ncbi:MAG: hypothetical protein ACSHX9_01630 [Luteolibacter sp.]
MNFHIKSAIFLLSMIISLDSHGQSAPETIKTELLTLSLNGVVPGYFYRNGKQVVKLTASTDGISPPVYYVGPRQLLLYENEADLGPPPEGEEPPKPAFNVAIAKGSDRTLMVFAFANKEKKRPSLKSYSIDDDTLKGGDYRIFNASTAVVYAIFNDKKVAVPPAKEGVVKAAGWGDRILDLNVNFGLKIGEEIKPVYSSVWGHRPERRSFIFVFQGSDKYRPLTIRKFYDIPSFKAKPRVVEEGDPETVP